MKRGSWVLGFHIKYEQMEMFQNRAGYRWHQWYWYWLKQCPLVNLHQLQQPMETLATFMPHGSQTHRYLIIMYSICHRLPFQVSINKNCTSKGINTKASHLVGIGSINSFPSWNCCDAVLYQTILSLKQSVYIAHTCIHIYHGLPHHSLLLKWMHEWARRCWHVQTPRQCSGCSRRLVAHWHLVSVQPR